MSPREQAANDLAQWVTDRRARFSAPYGIISDKMKDGRARAVTFGIARICDILVRIYSPTFIVIDDSRHGRVKVGSVDEAKALVSERYLGGIRG